MATETLSAEIYSVVRGQGDSGAAALRVCQQLEELRDKQILSELIAHGPPELETKWGECLAVAVQKAAAHEHNAEFAAFQQIGGHWHLLDLLSNVRQTDPSMRDAFYAQFNVPDLLSALLVALGTDGQLDIAAHHCTRNLARNPVLRQQLALAVPTLVDNLENDRLVQAAAAALCNVACHGEMKVHAVECGAVPRLVVQLRRAELSSEAAEDVMACMGVLTGNHEAGIAALFALAHSDGVDLTFGPLLTCLQREDAFALQCLSLEVVLGLCTASVKFKTWTVNESALVRVELPRMLRSENASVRMSALKAAASLVGVSGFTLLFQSSGGVGALQSILQREASGSVTGLMVRNMSSDPFVERREPTERDLAQHLMSKILLI